MQMKGKVASLLLWLILTFSIVLISVWMHQLSSLSPSSRESRQIELNLNFVIQKIHDELEWVAKQQNESIEKLPASADVRLIVSGERLERFETALTGVDKIELQEALLSGLKLPRQTHWGVTYWRDQVLLVFIHEKGERQSLSGLFFSDWLEVTSKLLNYSLSLSAVKGGDLDGEGHTVVDLPSLAGNPVYLVARSDSVPAMLPFPWWLALGISGTLSAVVVWWFYYRGVWMRLDQILKDTKQIMQSSDYKGRLQLEGKDEIADVVLQMNAIFRSLEYCYSLIAKTNAITSELMQKVETQALLTTDDTSLTEEGELKASLDVISRLSDALEKNTMEIFVQPVFGSDRSTIEGFEALPRWLDEELGMVAPLEFVSICEKAGLLDALTQFMLKQAVSALRSLQKKYGAKTRISLNVSASQFFSPVLIDTIQQISVQDRALLSFVELEVKESTITHNFDQAESLIARLKLMGVGVCIDDYGLSRYSLMYLQRIPVTSIKLAGSFTERLSWETKDAVFIDGVARFAVGLGLNVVVKNLENDAQIDSLDASLPIQYQGVSLSAPAPLDVVLSRG